MIKDNKINQVRLLQSISIVSGLIYSVFINYPNTFVEIFYGRTNDSMYSRKISLEYISLVNSTYVFCLFFLWLSCIGAFYVILQFLEFIFKKSNNATDKT